jgi:hydrogenase nickel incorporation protein HypA/HybF
MHEFGLAMRIVEMAEAHAAAQGGARLTRIEVELGELAGVMAESLDFSLKAVVRSSGSPEAEVLIHRIPGRAECAACGLRFQLLAPQGECPACGDPRLRVVQGREFRLKAIRLAPVG